MHRDRDRNPLTNAMAIIYDRALTHPRYLAAIDATFAELDALDIPSWEPARLIEAGGWTALILATFRRHIGDAASPGSVLIGDVSLKSLFGGAAAGEMRNALIARARARKDA